MGGTESLGLCWDQRTAGRCWGAGQNDVMTVGSRQVAKTEFPAHSDVVMTRISCHPDAGTRGDESRVTSGLGVSKWKLGAALAWTEKLGFFW